MLFCGKDIAAALGYINARDALSKHCRYVVKCDVPHPQSPTKEIEMTFIPEGDVYRLICNSKLPTAEKFERWVFDEVLPSIRKTGRYSVKETASYPTRPLTSDDYIKAAQLISSCRNERMPYVLYLLGKAGMSDLEKIKPPKVEIKREEFAGKSENEIYAEFISLLRDYSMKELIEKLPYREGTIYNWRRGLNKPRNLVIIFSTLREILQKSKEEGETA